MSYTELIVDQGATFDYRINLKNPDGSGMNVANNVFSGQVRKSYYSRKQTANLVINVVDASNGNVNIYLSAANTANIAAGRYVYDVKMVTPANVVTRISEGILTVTPQVTK